MTAVRNLHNPDYPSSRAATGWGAALPGQAPYYREICGIIRVRWVRTALIKSNKGMKEQAEIYRLSLMLGIFKVPDVVAWCDSVIMAESSPDIAIIKAAMAGSKGHNAVAHALSEVSGEFDKQYVVKQLLGIMCNLLKQDRKQASHIARCLYGMATDNYVPSEDAEVDMLSFWDSIDIATDGIYGDVDELTDELLQFLEKYSAATSPA